MSYADTTKGFIHAGVKTRGGSIKQGGLVIHLGVVYVWVIYVNKTRGGGVKQGGGGVNKGGGLNKGG